MRALGVAAAVVLTAIAFGPQRTVVAFAEDVPLAVRQGPVNNPIGDPVGRNIQHTPTLVDLGGGKLVAAFYDLGSFNGTNNHVLGYAYSSDNGVTWTDAGRLPNSAKGDSNNPVLAASKSAGAVFLMAQDDTSFETIPVFKSINSGHTFGAPVNGAPGYEGSGNAQFQPSMAIDNFAGSGNGNIYICWNRFEGSGPSEIRFSRSANGGASFGPNLGRLVGAGGPGCFITVSPNHQVSIFYLRGTGAGGQGGDNKLFMRRSTDRGVTFAPEVLVADLKTATNSGVLGLHGGVYAKSFPQAAVNPVAARPYLYVVYNDDPTPPPGGSNADNGDIYLVRSTNNGATWSGRIRINDDTAGDQFLPNIAFVNAGERLMVSYFSRSHDLGNFTFHRRARLAALNSAGGAAFSPSFQLGPDTLPLGPTSSAFVSNYIGEYEGIAGGAGAVSTVWADGRRATSKGGYQYDIYFARIAAAPPNTKLTVIAKASPASVRLGENTTITITASAATGPANDAVVHVNPTFGLSFLEVTPSSGSCTFIGQTIDCLLGTIPSGGSRTVSIVTAGVESVGARKVNVLVTTSSRSAASAAEVAHRNEDEELSLGVTQPARPPEQITLSRDVNIPIPEASNTLIGGVAPGFVPVALSPEDDVHGKIIRITPKIRLNFAPDGDLAIRLGLQDALHGFDFYTALSDKDGGEGYNFGTGRNDCSGRFASFRNGAIPNVVDREAPFEGLSGPRQPMFLGRPVKDLEVLVVNFSLTQAGFIGCVEVDITYVPRSP